MEGDFKKNRERKGKKETEIKRTKLCFSLHLLRIARESLWGWNLSIQWNCLDKSTRYSILHILYYYFDVSKNMIAKLYNPIWNYRYFCHRKKKKGERRMPLTCEHMICSDSTLYLQSLSPGRLCSKGSQIKSHAVRLTGNNSGALLSSTEMTHNIEHPNHASKYIPSEFN